MATRDKRIDAYIARSADFAQPMLRYLREVVHDGCPEAEETMKWSFPHFMYKGILCSMAAFKQHCAFGFWKGSLILGQGENKAADGMGQFGRITSMKDLPPKKTLLEYVRKAKQLHDDGVKVPRKPRPRGVKKELEIPDYFTAAVKKNQKAQTSFDAFPYSHKKEYVQWVTEAKTEETREPAIADSSRVDGRRKSAELEIREMSNRVIRSSVHHRPITRKTQKRACWGPGSSGHRKSKPLGGQNDAILCRFDVCSVWMDTKKPSCWAI